MIIRLFNKIAASLNHLPYPPPEPPTGPDHHVSVQAGGVLLYVDNREYLLSAPQMDRASK